MQQYLQQCLGYHHEQEEQRRKEQEAPIVDTSTEIQFVPAVVETPLDTIEYAPAASLDTTAQPQTSTIEDTSLVQSQVQEGRLRVQEILKRFQQQQEQFLQSQSSVPPTEDIDGTATTTAITDIALIPDITTPSLSQQQRTTGFQREAVRKHGALLKNLEYVAAKQERRLYELNAQAEQSRLDQARMQDHHRAVLEERKRARTMWNDSSQSAAAVAGIGIGIGIGTQQRIKVSEHNKRSKGRVPLDGGTIADTDEQTSVAIYLSGLATDGSFGEDSVRGLFSSYGKMVKVHVYRNKRTGGLKGDALIVYQVPDKTEGDALIQMVCSQVSNAMLSSPSSSCWELWSDVAWVAVGSVAFGH
jgi:uncharacterized coiled-coil protein SlyX